MPLTNAARDQITTLLAGVYDSANAHIGVGDSATAFVKTQTDLQGASQLRKAMDAGFPNGPSGNDQNGDPLGANQMEYRVTFAQNEANFDWDEIGIFNAGAAGTMLTRKVEALGTKPNTQVWELTYVVEVNNP